MPKHRARGNVRSKYAAGNLRMINSTGFISIPTKPVEVSKSLEIPTKKSRPKENANSLNPDASLKKDDATTSRQTRQSYAQQKKDIPKNLGSHYLSNFLALSQTVETLPKGEVKKHSQYFKNKQTLSEIPSGSKESFKEIPKVASELKSSKLIPPKMLHKIKTPTKIPPNSNMSPKTQPKTKLPTRPLPITKNEIGPDTKKKPDSGKKFELFDKDLDLRFLNQPQSMSREKEKLYQPKHFKESSYRDFKYLPKEDYYKLKGKPGSSKKSEIPYTKDHSLWKKERYTSRHSLPYKKEADYSKMTKRSREHFLERERYYKSKSHKYGDKEKDYKQQKFEKHPKSKYSWYNKDYVHKKNYTSESHSSKKHYDYHKEKRNIRLEDYEEVASLEDSSEDLKVPVHFRKCLVRYLSYSVYNYFRPKWYFLSRKRYVVNCLYGSLKKGKSSRNDPDVLKPSPADDVEMVSDSSLVNEDTIENEAIIDEETIKDAAIVDHEEMDNLEMNDDALLNDNKEKEIIEDANGKTSETIQVTLLNEDSGDTIEDENVEAIDDALLEDDTAGEKDDKLDDALLNDNGTTLEDAGDENDEMLDDALLEDDNQEALENVDDEMLDDALLEDNSKETVGDAEDKSKETCAEADNKNLERNEDGNEEVTEDVEVENIEMIENDDEEYTEDVDEENLEIISNGDEEFTEDADGENMERIDKDNEINEDVIGKNVETVDDNDKTRDSTLLDDTEKATKDSKGKMGDLSSYENIEAKDDISVIDNSIKTENVSSAKINEATVEEPNVDEDDDEICILHVGKKVKDAICIVIDDKESEDSSIVQDDNKEKVGAVVAQDKKGKGDSVSTDRHNETDGDDICIINENVTKQQSIDKCVEKFNRLQKQAAKITQNYLKLQQISSKKIVPNKNQKGKNNPSSMDSNTKKVQNENAVSLQVKPNTTSAKEIIPSENSNSQKAKSDLSSVGSNTVKAQNETEKSLQTKFNQRIQKTKKKQLVFKQSINCLAVTAQFRQGNTAIQSNLRDWNSHLIGLEYIIEVQDNADKKIIKLYHCGLCVEDFLPQENIAQVVINHVISYKHMCNYMAKHFPSSDYNFSESVRNYVNEIMLQTCCEEINHKLGYNFMCIVKENFFQKDYDMIKKHFSAMKHWGESDIDIFPSLIVKQLESDICKEAGCVVEDIMNKIAPAEPKGTFFIPQTIVSSSRRSNPKDKMKDILKASESVVNRSSQNTLIVLTTPTAPPVKAPLSAGLSSPKKLAPSKALTIAISKQNTQEEVQEGSQEAVIDSVGDSKRNQDGDSVTVKDGLRIVRLRQSHNRPLAIEDSDEEEETGLNTSLAPNQASAEIEPSKEGVGVTDNLQAEDISDNDFSDVELVQDVSPGNKSGSKSQKQPHKHSRYCPKRKAWIKGDSLQTVGEKESHKNVHSPSSDIPSIGKSSKRYSSHSHKKHDERSQDSFTSNSSKRRRRSPSSSSPSLEEFLRKLSPSPVRKRSPLRVSSAYRTPGSSRRYSRMHSRSPPLKHPRSTLYRKRSKSPIRHRSKSPLAHRSKSPIRRRSRSPYRKRSRSPIRRRSRSPIRKLSRSPIRKRSRSPRGRSPLRNRSRSPYSGFKSNRNDRSLKSPPRRYRVSRSPDKPHSKLPPRKYSRSPSRQHARPKSPFADPATDSRIPGSYKRTSSSTLSQHQSKTESRKERNDLEEISDEDESKYFNTNTSPEIPKYMDEIIQKLPESARIMLVKVMQKFNLTNINVNHPSFLELMKFVASHSSEIQRLMSQPSALPEMNTQVPSNPSAQSQESFLHQYILKGMKGNFNMPSQAGPSTSNIFPGPSSISFQQPSLQPMVPSQPYLSSRPDSTSLSIGQQSINVANQFGQPIYQQPTSSVGYPMQGIHVNPNFVQHPPQQVPMNVPMAQQQLQFQQNAYKQVSPQKPTIPPPQPKRTTEGMFQNLKATVSKIFGGEDVMARFKIPGINDHPSEAKYSDSIQNNQSVNPVYQSPHDHKVGQYVTNVPPTRVTDNVSKSYSQKEGGAFLGETQRENTHVPPPDAKVSFCDVQRAPMQKNLFPVVNNPERSYTQENVQVSVNDAKKSLAQRLAAVLVKIGMVDVPAHLLQEMLMKIGAFSMNPPQDISEGEILTILRKLKYVV